MQHQKPKNGLALAVITLCLIALPSLIVVSNRWLELTFFEKAGAALLNLFPKESYFKRFTYQPFYLLNLISMAMLALLTFVNWRGIIREDCYRRDLTAVPVQCGGGRKTLVLFTALIACIAFSLHALTYTDSLDRNRFNSWPFIYSLAAYLFVLAAVSVFQGRISRGGTEHKIPGAFILLALLSAIFVLVISMRIEHWAYTAVGDEFPFMTRAVDILAHESPFSETGRLLFWGTEVYGSHPFFSNAFQAAIMSLMQPGMESWRLSSVLTVVFSVPFLFAFFRMVFNDAAALFIAACTLLSHYLISFAPIGYNNTQALFVASLVLFTAGKSAFQGNLINFGWLGISAGLAFYTYPAALYCLPVAALFLVIYGVKDKRFLKGCIFAAGSFFLVIIPLLNQDLYWASKKAGTLFNVSQLLKPEALTFHLISNTLYTLVSPVMMAGESHFVTISLLDPILAGFYVFGLYCHLTLLFKSRLSLFLIGAFTVEVFFVGVSHDRAYPPLTRMFMLLPFYIALAVSGAFIFYAYCRERFGIKKWLGHLIFVFFGIAIFSTNFAQANYLGLYRTAGYQSLVNIMLNLDRNLWKAGFHNRRYLVLYKKHTRGYQFHFELRGKAPVIVEIDLLKIRDLKVIDSYIERGFFIIPDLMENDPTFEVVNAYLRVKGLKNCAITNVLGHIRGFLWNADHKISCSRINDFKVLE